MILYWMIWRYKTQMQRHPNEDGFPFGSGFPLFSWRAFPCHHCHRLAQYGYIHFWINLNGPVFLCLCEAVLWQCPLNVCQNYYTNKLTWIILTLAWLTRCFNLILQDTVYVYFVLFILLEILTWGIFAFAMSCIIKCFLYLHFRYWLLVCPFLYSAPNLDP